MITARRLLSQPPPCGPKQWLRSVRPRLRHRRLLLLPSPPRQLSLKALRKPHRLAIPDPNHPLAWPRPVLPSCHQCRSHPHCLRLLARRPRLPPRVRYFNSPSHRPHSHDQLRTALLHLNLNRYLCLCLCLCLCIHLNLSWSHLHPPLNPTLQIQVQHRNHLNQLGLLRHRTAIHNLHQQSLMPIQQPILGYLPDECQR